MTNDLQEKVFNALHKVERKLEFDNYAGYEVFDGLNTPLFNNAIFYNSKLLRLCVTQFFKKVPLNLRSFFFIAKTQDVKGLALCLQSYLLNGNTYRAEEIYHLLLTKRLENKHYWGYTWPYQLVAHYAKKDDPNVIATLFVLDSFLDYYEISPSDDLKEVINKTAEDLYAHFYLKDKGYFSYFLNTDFGVYNAIALSAYVLARTDLILKGNNYVDSCYNAINYVIKKQRSDGAWYYGDLKNHNFIDHFHTIYNLQALRFFGEILKYPLAQESYIKGNEYYINNLFRSDRLPKLYHNKDYPLDIHCFASAIIYLTQTGQKPEYLEKILNYVIDEMQLPSGDFIFRVCSFYTNRNIYMRWCNAWMFYALSYYLKAFK